MRLLLQVLGGIAHRSSLRGVAVELSDRSMGARSLWERAEQWRGLMEKAVGSVRMGIERRGSGGRIRPHEAPKRHRLPLNVRTGKIVLKGFETYYPAPARRGGSCCRSKCQRQRYPIARRSIANSEVGGAVARCQASGSESAGVRSRPDALKGIAKQVVTYWQKSRV